MRILKKILVFLLTLNLIFLIGTFVSSFHVKELINEQIINQLIQKELSKSMSEELEVGEEKVKEILQKKEIEEFINKYIDITIESFTNDEVLNNVIIGEDIIEFIKENETQIEQEFNIDISTDQINEILENNEIQEITNQYKETIITAKEKTPESIESVLKIYSFIISSNFKLILGILIVLTLVFIALLQKRVYKWLLSLGIGTLFGGIISTTIILAGSIIINYILNYLELNTTISVIPIITTSFLTIILGIIILIVYTIIRNKENNNMKIKKED